MKKNFTFVLPDEPYTSKTENNNVINAVYEGPRYILCRVNKSTDLVEGVVRFGEQVSDFDGMVNEEGYDFLTIDASVNTFEAAYISGNYKHEEIPDPTFELPRGLGTWTYHYDDFTGGINQAFYQHTMKYKNGKFIAPGYRLHALSRESVMEGAKITAKTIKESLAVNDFEPEDRKKLEDYAEWLSKLDETYHDVDHWKITFPVTVPKY